MTVEAIKFTSEPMLQEKNRAMMEIMQYLVQSLDDRKDPISMIQEYVDDYLYHINMYDDGSIDFAELLRRIQPLSLLSISNENEDISISQFNAIISSINALRDSESHRIVFEQLTKQIQLLIHPEIKELELWEMGR